MKFNPYLTMSAILLILWAVCIYQDFDGPIGHIFFTWAILFDLKDSIKKLEKNQQKG